MVEYNKEKIAFSRKLRKNMTAAERKLWYLFLRTYPVRFQRQKILGEYIADFYCAKARLVIEIDSEQHNSPQNIIKEKYRTRYLEDKSIHIMRFTNNDIDEDFYSVCKMIDTIVQRKVN